MERTMSVEEKIRRAEEIYARRRAENTREVSKININNNKKDIKLLKKMIIQLIVCVSIYFTIYFIQNKQYVFSEDLINKVNEILSYDTNFVEIYNILKDKTKELIGQKEDTQQNQNLEQEKNENNEENSNAEIIETQDNTEVNGIGGAEENTSIELSQEDQDIINVKNTTTFIKPIDGIITSTYGWRETATGNVPKNHTGTDIGANMGTKIKAATDGEVVIASSEGDYRKTFKNSDRRSKCNLCTLQ